MTMTIDEKYDNALQMLHGYYDGKNERLRIARSVLNENGFNTDFHGEFVSMICPRLGREGILKESPFSFLPSDKGIIDQERYRQLSRKMEMADLSFTEFGKIQNEISALDRIITFVVDGKKLDTVYKKKKSVADGNATDSGIAKNTPASIYLIGDSIVPSKIISMVLDEDYQHPNRFAVQNNEGKEAVIKKLYDIVYSLQFNASDKVVAYSEGLKDSINNDVFKKPKIAEHIKSNHLKKPMLVSKSSDGRFILAGDTTVKIVRPNEIPLQFRSQYPQQGR